MGDGTRRPITEVGLAKRMKTSKVALTWLGVCVASAALALVFIPWPTPYPEIRVEEFVPDLLTVDVKGFQPRAGRVAISRNEIELKAVPRSQPTVHVLTSEVPFTAAFSVSVRERYANDTYPFQIKVWNPSHEVAVEAWYGPDGVISAGFRSQNTWKHTRGLLNYAIGGREVWTITSDGKGVTFEVSASGGRAIFEVRPETFADVFRQPSLSLTMYATAPGAGRSEVIIRDPAISVPRQTRYGTTAQGTWYRVAVGFIACVALLWLVAVVRSQGGVSVGRLTARLRVPGRHVAVLIVVSALSLCLGWQLSRVPGHPYDVRSATVWSHVARQYGLSAILRHPQLGTERDAHGGQPYAAMVYPYPPPLTYFFWLVGRIAPEGHTASTLKTLLTLVTVAGGVGIFVLLRSLRVAPAAATLAASAYMLNPAVLFDGAVWGQTDAVMAFFLLLGAAGIVSNSAALLWTGVILAALTKQTGALFAPVLLLLAGTRLGVRPMIRDLPIAIVVVFLFLTPAFLAGIHPSTIYRPMITKLLEFGAAGNGEVTIAVASLGAFNLWPVLAATEGAQGWTRLAFPDLTPTYLSLSHFVWSRIAFGLLAVILALIVFKRKPLGVGTEFLVLAAYGVGMAVLLTRVHPRYMFFGLMFTAAALPWMPRRLGIPTLLVLTGTMLTALWGMMVFTSIWHPGLLPAFAPDRFWLHRAAAVALGSDLGITIGGLLNMAALLALLSALWGAVLRTDHQSRIGNSAERYFGGSR